MSLRSSGSWGCSAAFVGEFCLLRGSSASLRAANRAGDLSEPLLHPAQARSAELSSVSGTPDVVRRSTGTPTSGTELCSSSAEESRGTPESAEGSGAVGTGKVRVRHRARRSPLRNRAVSLVGWSRLWHERWSACCTVSACGLPRASMVSGISHRGPSLTLLGPPCNPFYSAWNALNTTKTT